MKNAWKRLPRREEGRPSADHVAPNRVDSLYGLQGPPRGTTLAENRPHRGIANFRPLNPILAPSLQYC